MAAPAPLTVPSGVKAPRGEVFGFEGAGGFFLRAALFRPRGKPRGSVVLSGGRTETIEKYYEVIGELTGRGLVVLAHDWRGQGGSQRLLDDRLAGHADNVDDFLSDYRALLARFGAELPRPWIAMGHSMGGCLTLLAVEHGAGPMDGVVLSAPMLCLKFKGFVRHIADVLAWTMVAAGFGRRPAPGPLNNPLEDHFDHDRLTHDRERYLRFKAVLRAEPSLALGHPTWGWLKFALEATRRVRDQANLDRVKAPVLIVGAGEDRLCESGAAASVAARLPHGHYEEIDDAYHEVLMETDERRAVFWSAFDDFVEPLISPRAAGRSAPRRARPARRK